MNGSVTYLSCSVVGAELHRLHRQGRIDGPVHVIDSRLHKVPDQLATRLDDQMHRLLEDGRKVVLVLGECTLSLGRGPLPEGVVRVDAINCVDMLVGRPERRRLLHDGAFFLLPEWTRRWREILTRLLELDDAATRELFRDQHRYFVYLDTGIVPVPEAALAECSDHFDLPVSVEPVTLDHLHGLLVQAKDRLT